MTELKTVHGYHLWLYLPSVPAAVIFTILFLLSALLHTWKIYKTRAWFCTSFTIGCLFEAIGYAARASAHDQTDRIIPYVLQSTFILVAPALFAASIYMTLSRLIFSVNGASLSPIRPRWLTTLFVTGDVVSFLVQAGAAGLMVSGGGSGMKTGENVVVAGLMVQIVMFGLFCITAGVFHKRIRRTPTRESYEVEVGWEGELGMLYVVSGLVMVRSVFRVVEYAMGQEGYLLGNEWTLYVFDGTLMWLATVIFFWRFPSGINKPKDGDVEHVQLRGVGLKA